VRAFAAPVTLGHLAGRLDDPYSIGFPPATDIDFTPIADLLANTLAINLGDWRTAGQERRNLKDLEQLVDGELTRIFRGERDRWWGYLSSSTTGAIRHAITTARALLPRRRWRGGPILYASASAHPCVAKIAQELRLPMIPVPSRHGRMDLSELAGWVHPRRPAILLATIGTTMAEGIDDVAGARRILHDMGAAGVWVHGDAALSGMPLALDPDPPAGARLDDEVLDSLSVSGHKFPGTKTPSAWLTMRTEALDGAPRLAYSGDWLRTAEGCRSGHDALRWHYVLDTLGADGHRRRAERARHSAARLTERLCALGGVASRYPHAFTVVFADPPARLVAKYGLATQPVPGVPHRLIGHVVTVPGVQEWVLDEFVDDMRREWHPRC